MAKRSVDYAEYVGLLRELHKLIANGKLDAPEADEIRDQMDRPWYGMSEDEHELVGLLSADLYTLSELPPSVQAPPVIDKEEFDAHLSQMQYREALKALDHTPGLVTAHEAAVIRARAWLSFGHADVASEFVTHAHRLSEEAAKRRRKGPEKPSPFGNYVRHEVGLLSHECRKGTEKPFPILQAA